MKKTSRSIVISLLFAILILFIPQTCNADPIFKPLQFNKTVKGTVKYIDNHICDESCEGLCEPECSHKFTYKANTTNDRYRLKFTITISNVKYNDDYYTTEIPRIYLFDDSEEYAWSHYFYDAYEKGSETVSKIITTKGDISCYIGDIGIYGEMSSFDYTLRVDDCTPYATRIRIPQTLHVETGNTKTISPVIVEPTNSVNTGITWNSSNKNIAVVDRNGKITAKKQGTCYINATLKNGRIYKCKLVVKNPAPYINYYKATMYKGQKFRLRIMYSNKKTKWSSSNKKIATVSSNGTLKANQVGKCTITGKIGRKKYTCKVNVVYRNPNFGAVVTGYNTRNNYFTVKFRNLEKRAVIIQPYNAKVEHVAYKTYDRYLRLPNNKPIYIRPGKNVYVRFYVRGKVTWYDYSRYTLCYKFTYDGKTYDGHVWDEDSVFKRGKSWYHTFWQSSEDWYYTWY